MAIKYLDAKRIRGTAAERAALTVSSPPPQTSWKELARVTLSSTATSFGTAFADKDNIEVKTGFAKVLDAATGCLLIKRECLLKMVKEYPDLHYNTDQIIDGKEYKSKNTYLFFDTMKDEDGRYLSEDYAFSRRWQKIGGSIWADLSSDLIHYGQYKFQGQLWKHFNKKT